MFGRFDVWLLQRWVFVSMTFGTWLLTIFRGRFVGADELGNRYYRARKRGDMRRERRWVVYRGKTEASKVPPMWHAWLCHTIAEPPFDKAPTRASWRKEHLPNLTGTSKAYRPSGAIETAAPKSQPQGYEAWRPN